MINKYEKIKNILQNGDICEIKTWDDKITFGLYMDGYLYKDQKNNVVCALGGFELNVVAIRRPKSMRNAFACFKYGSLYNYNYSEFGVFETIYDEDNFIKRIDSINKR